MLLKIALPTLLPYHLLPPSPWPVLVSASVLPLAVALVASINGFSSPLLLSFLSVGLYTYLWLRDVLRESLYEGSHGSLPLLSIKYGMLLFIASEAALFSSLFWAFLNTSLTGSLATGFITPPLGLVPPSPWALPLLNTLLLLTSGATLTVCHNALLSGRAPISMYLLSLTLLLALLFTGIQGYEYTQAAFCYTDSAYGCSFYSLTGLHGLHVLLGTLYLLSSLTRLFSSTYTSHKHVQFELAA